MERLCCFESWQIQKKNVINYKINFVRNIAKKINRDIINYIETGSYGSAYRIDGYNVMKITTDKREAFTAYSLIGENTKNIVKYYEVYELESSKLTVPTYVLIMEFLITLLEYGENVREFFDYFSANYNQEDFFKYNEFSPTYLRYFKGEYFKNCENCLSEEQVDESIEKLKNIAIDTKKYNIYPVDVHSGNVGFRIINGDLIYFDVGINENYDEVELKKIIL